MSLQSNDGQVTNPVSYLYLMGQKNQLNMSILLSPFTSSVNTISYWSHYIFHFKNEIKILSQF